MEKLTFLKMILRAGWYLFNNMTNHRILGMELMLIFGGVWVGYLEEFNLIFRTISLIVATAVGALNGYKIIKEFKSNKEK